jgi:hypothetical protein
MLGTMAIGEEAIVPDALKALGEHVEQKPTDKLLDREAHHLHFVAMSVVAPTETDLAVFATQEALVTDSDPMGIAPEVGEHLPGTAEGRLGVDHPILGSELGEERAEVGRRCERGGLPGEASVGRVPAPFIGGMIPPCLITVAPMCRVTPISSRSTPIGAKPFSPMSMCARPCGKRSERFVRPIRL